jgi:hypothetical protein
LAEAAVFFDGGSDENSLEGFFALLTASAAVLGEMASAATGADPLAALRTKPSARAAPGGKAENISMERHCLPMLLKVILLGFAERERDGLLVFFNPMARAGLGSSRSNNYEIITMRYLY